MLRFASSFPISARPKSLPGINFIKVLTEHEDAFDVLYCIAFEMMDAQWLAMRASYMEFKVSQSFSFLLLNRTISCVNAKGLLELHTGRDGGNKAAAGEGALSGGSPWHPGPSCLQPLVQIKNKNATCSRREEANCSVLTGPDDHVLIPCHELVCICRDTSVQI